MRTPGQRGTFGSWLTAERTRRYKTQREALDAMRRLAGLRIAESEYAQWESGSRVPREDNPKVARLYEFFGSRPEEPREEPADLPTMDRLVRLLEVMEQRLATAERRADLLEQIVLREVPSSALHAAIAAIEARQVAPQPPLRQSDRERTAAQ